MRSYDLHPNGLVLRSVERAHKGEFSHPVLASNDTRVLCYSKGVRLLLSLIVVGIFLTPTKDADACSCRGASIETWPAKGSIAPTNARILVRFPGGKKEKTILRLRGTQDTAGVPSARVDTVSMQVRFVELTPSVKLAKGAHYEVVVGSGKNARVVSNFLVGEKVDTTVPKPPVVDTAKFNHEEAVCCNCTSGAPHIRIALAGKHDMDSPSSLMGIWMADANAKVDWKRAPDAYVITWNGQLTLGDSSMCSVNNFPIAAAGTMTLGLRAISPSGRWSKGEITKVKVTPKSKSVIFLPRGK